MVFNLVYKIVSGLSVGWTDNTVVLCWLNKSENYTPFITNRINKIKQSKFSKRQHVPTKQAPTDIGSRGCFMSKMPNVWWVGPCGWQTVINGLTNQ